MSPAIRFSLSFGVVGAFVGCLSSSVLTQGAAHSVDGAKRLAAQLASKHATAVGGKDMAEAGRYVAALYVPGVELIVASAKFDDTSAPEYEIYTGNFMGLYEDVNAAAAAKNRITIEDLGADGLVAMPKKDAAADTFTEMGKPMVFDGDYKAKKLSMDAYMKAFGAADATYAHFLDILNAQFSK